MAKKSTVAEAGGGKTPGADLQRPAAETLYADELARLAAQSADLPRPPGWRLTPRAVLAFILGDEKQGLAPKFVGRRSFLERCIVALATNRGLMLIGEPGRGARGPPRTTSAIRGTTPCSSRRGRANAPWCRRRCISV
jgi:hypothetical protein